MFEQIGGDLYLKTVDSNKRVTVSYHRYWDRNLLIASKTAQALNAKEGPGKVSVITFSEFKALGGRQ